MKMTKKQAIIRAKMLMGLGFNVLLQRDKQEEQYYLLIITGLNDDLLDPAI